MGAGPGFGLTRLGVSDQTPTWDVDYPRVLREENPDLIVVMLGIWDQFFIEQHGILAYTKVVQKATEILLSTGAKVVFMAIPPGGKHPERRQNGGLRGHGRHVPGPGLLHRVRGCAPGSERRLPDDRGGRRRLHPAPAQGRRLALLPGRGASGWRPSSTASPWSTGSPCRPATGGGPATGGRRSTTTTRLSGLIGLPARFELRGRECRRCEGDLHLARRRSCVVPARPTGAPHPRRPRPGLEPAVPGTGVRRGRGVAADALRRAVLRPHDPRGAAAISTRSCGRRPPRSAPRSPATMVSTGASTTAWPRVGPGSPVSSAGSIAPTAGWSEHRSHRFSLAFAAASETIAFSIARWADRHHHELFDDVERLDGHALPVAPGRGGRAQERGVRRLRRGRRIAAAPRRGRGHDVHDPGLVHDADPVHAALRLGSVAVAGLLAPPAPLGLRHRLRDPSRSRVLAAAWSPSEPSGRSARAWWPRCDPWTRPPPGRPPPDLSAESTDSAGTVGPPTSEGDTVHYRKLGRTGLQVSPLCLGAMMFGAVGQPRPRRLDRDHPRRARRRHQLHRHRRRLLDGRVRGDRGQGHRRSPRRGRAGHQVLRPDGRGPEPQRRLALLDHEGVRGQPAPARHRPHRPLPGAPTRPDRRHRRDPRRSQRPRAPGQGPLPRQLDTSRPPRSSRRSGSPNGATGSASCASSRRTRSSCAASSPTCCRPASATAWA